MELIDSRLLTRLVEKHSVEYVTKPLERRKLWLELTREYNTAKESNVNHARLAKRWHNMKQRARRKITVIKKKAIQENRKRGINIDKLVKNELAVEMEEGSEDVIDSSVVSIIQGAAIEEEKNSLPTFIVQQEGEKDKKATPKKAGTPGETEKEEDEKSDDETSKSKKDALLRDLLVCLVKKYRADEPKGGPSAKNRIWADLSREYHRLSGGLLNANQKQLLTKWNNLKFHARQRGKPNPVDDADELNAEDISKKLKPFRQLLDDAAVERELEAELQKDYLFASALHGHKMSLVKQDRGPSPPPAPIQHRKIRRSDLNIGEGEQDGDLSSHSKSLKSLERQIFMETLRYEQERLQLLRDNADLESQKLRKDIELADIQLETARLDLARKHNI